MSPTRTKSLSLFLLILLTSNSLANVSSQGPNKSSTRAKPTTPVQTSSLGSTSSPTQTKTTTATASGTTKSGAIRNITGEARIKTTIGSTSSSYATTAVPHSSPSSLSSATTKRISVSSVTTGSGFKDVTISPTTISAKETRESPGKIRPQIKLTTNYTSASDVSNSIFYNNEFLS